MTTYKFNARFAFVTRSRFDAYIDIANEKFNISKGEREGEEDIPNSIDTLKEVTLVNNSVKYI
jgi:hypothetical protein